MTKSQQTTGSKFNRPHMIIPQEDTTWAISQKPCVLRFWQQCWLADPFGSRWMKLVTNLSDSAFRFARRVLEAASLFTFRRISFGSDGRTSIWEVRNLHGARVKDFWLSEKNKANTASNKADIASVKVDTTLEKASIRTKTQSEQVFQQVSGTAQEHLTNSTKEFVRCVSDTLTQISREEETAIAPLGVASPQIVESVSEKKEELPVVTDCTTLALVEAAPSQSTSLLAENQDCSVEPKDCYEGTCSAAPIAQNEFASSSAIANQTQGQVEAGNPTSLLVENSVSGVEVKTVHEGESSAAPVPNPEKWSHEAIVARANARPERMQKLKVAANSGQHPGFEYLQECWDDPALQIVIKKLLVKFPCWGIVCVDGVLIEWND